MSDPITPNGWSDWRVLFQYLDVQGHPRFEFTTVLAATNAAAGDALARSHQQDIGFSVVQVTASNGTPTGFAPEQSAAAIVGYATRVNEAGEPV